MKKFLPVFIFIAIFLGSILDVNAQNTAISDDDLYNPDPSAMLDVKSTNKGVLIPRLTTAQRLGVASPATGLLVFDSSIGCFFYFTGTVWTNLSAGNPNNLFSKNSNRVYLEDTLNRVGLGIKFPTGKLVVQGDNSLPDTIALFEVKDKTGNTVFAVYPNGARLYLPEGAKGNVSGFAVSGRNSSKITTINEYFRVTPDSVRVYIKENGAKGNAGGFAVSGRNTSKSNTLKNYFNVSIDTSEIINPSQSRVLWYPTKEAFLAGRVYIPHRDSIGKNSLSVGYETKAMGNYSQAMGYKSIAKGIYSMAIGKQATAFGLNSFAFGAGATANAKDAYAIGAGASAEGIGSFAFGSFGRDTLGNVAGSPTRATGDYAFAFGLGAFSSGMGAVSVGANNEASGKFSLSMGYSTESKATYSTAVGFDASATGFSSSAIGTQTVASAPNAIAIGFSSIASGMGAFAIGYSAVATGINSTALGHSTEASGINATAVGNGTIAQSYNSVAVGSFNTAAGNGTMWSPMDPIFVVGNGTTGLSRSDAMVVLKNAFVGIGTSNPNSSMDVNGALALRRTTVIMTNGINIDLNLSENTFVKVVGPTAAFNVGGIGNGFDGKLLILYNSTNQNMTLKHENLVSLPGNRIVTMTGADITTTGTGSFTLMYDAEATRWVVISYQQ